MGLLILISLLMMAPLMMGGSDDVVSGDDAADDPIGDPSGDDPDGMPVGDLMDDPDDGSDDDTPTDDLVSLRAGDDVLEGTAQDDTLEGFAGDDLISGGAGDDSLNGDAYYFGDPRNGGVYYEDLDPLVEGDDTLNGGDGNDTLGGQFGADLLNGDAGNDQLEAGEGDDTLDGGTGDDRLYGGGGADVAFGGSGDDTIFGQRGNDLLRGGAGDDEIFGDEGVDTLLGGAGNDTLEDDRYYYLVPAADLVSEMDGGAGDDLLRFLAGSTITGGAGADTMQGAADGSIDAITQITDFNPAEDTLALDVIVGDGSSGSLTLQDWADGTGASLMIGDQTIAEITGAQGLAVSGVVTPGITLADGEVRYTDGDEGSTILANSNGNGQIFGAGGDDWIDAGDIGEGRNYGQPMANANGSNFVNGGNGDDTVLASGGYVDGPYVEQSTEDDGTFREYLVAAQEFSQDTIEGGAGDDLLAVRNGGILTGGGGADTFALSHETGLEGLTPETPLQAFPPAVITDFEQGVDTLVVRYIGATPLVVTPWDNGQGADVLQDDEVIARIIGGQNLTVADIRTVNNLSDVILESIA